MFWETGAWILNYRCTTQVPTQRFDNIRIMKRVYGWWNYKKYLRVLVDHVRGWSRYNNSKHDPVKVSLVDAIEKVRSVKRGTRQYMQQTYIFTLWCICLHDYNFLVTVKGNGVSQNLFTKNVNHEAWITIKAHIQTVASYTTFCDLSGHKSRLVS